MKGIASWHTDLKIEPFKKWLTERGAEVLAPTNPYELVRFRTTREVSIVYKNGRGVLNYQGEAAEAYKAFLNQNAWDAGIAKAPKHLPKRSSKMKALLDRDGEDCFYCGQAVRQDDETIEHILSRAHGGSNHIANLARTHSQCNQDAGHLSVAEKIRRREVIRAGGAA